MHFRLYLSVMHILGITGAIGHGKTSLADAFLRQIKSAQHVESSGLISRVADGLNQHYVTARPQAGNPASINAWLSNLPDILRDVAHYTGDIPPIRVPSKDAIHADAGFQKLDEYLRILAQNHSLVTQRITEQNKETYRPLLQWLGGFVTKHINPTLWYDELLRQAREAESQGCELFVIGGVRFPSDAQVIHAAGGHIVAIERPTQESRDAQDSTEAFRSMVPTDATIINDGELGALDHIVVNIWKDLKQDNLQPRYQSSRTSFTAGASPSVRQRDML